MRSLNSSRSTGSGGSFAEEDDVLSSPKIPSRMGKSSRSPARRSLPDSAVAIITIVKMLKP